MHETKRWIYLLDLEGFFLSVIVLNLCQSLTQRRCGLKEAEIHAQTNSMSDIKFI